MDAQRPGVAGDVLQTVKIVTDWITEILTDTFTNLDVLYEEEKNILKSNYLCRKYDNVYEGMKKEWSLEGGWVSQWMVCFQPCTAL